jgi:hypothetical protein
VIIQNPVPFPSAHGKQRRLGYWQTVKGCQYPSLRVKQAQLSEAAQNGYKKPAMPANMAGFHIFMQLSLLA